MRALRTYSLWLFLLVAPFAVSCTTSNRDAQAIATDIEGPVAEASIDRAMRYIDLEQAALTISVGSDAPARFTAGDQPALETFLREASEALSGAQLRVTQQVLEETGDNTQRLTVTIAVEHEGHTRYVPVVLDLVRDGRRVLVTRARVMG